MVVGHVDVHQRMFRGKYHGRGRFHVTHGAGPDALVRKVRSLHRRTHRCPCARGADENLGPRAAGLGDSPALGNPSPTRGAIPVGKLVSTFFSCLTSFALRFLFVTRRPRALGIMPFFIRLACWMFLRVRQLVH